MTKYSKKTERIFLLVLSFTFILLTFFLIKDIFSLIIYSLILAYFLSPLYLYYDKKLQNKKISALLTLLTSVFVLFIPLILMTYFLILNLFKLVVEYREYIENPEILNTVINTFLGEVTNSSILSSINFSDFINKGVIFILNISNNFFSSIPRTILYFFITLFITYYILVHNKAILRGVNEYLPLSLKKQNEILKNVAKNIKVLFRGYFLTGLIQTAVALFGYVIFGAPNILIITFLTLLASLIPYLGTPLIWVPVSIYMIITGNEFGGIWLLVYGTLIINFVDNFVRPILMSDKDTIPPALVFIGFVGGLLAFGFVGLILGPIIISITSILLKYVKEAYGTNFE